MAREKQLGKVFKDWRTGTDTGHFVEGVAVCRSRKLKVTSRIIEKCQALEVCGVGYLSAQ